MRNALLVLEAIIQLNEVLRRAASEGRDVSDDEVAALRRQNDALLDDLLRR